MSLRDRLRHVSARARQPESSPEPEVPGEDEAILARAMPFSMTGRARLQAVVDAVRHCVGREIPGAFAECGVWRGGSILAMVLTLQELGETERDIFLFDTFEGMSEPGELDVSPSEGAALEAWRTAASRGDRPWDELFGEHVFDETSVRKTLLETGYPEHRLQFVAGDVIETIPERAPSALAMLRLDTDWYESTSHELTHLYPRLAPGGVLIVDDYGHWQGARRAVDEYFAENPPRPLLSRIDYTGRIAVKA